MIIKDINCTLNGKNIVLRSAGPEDAPMMIEFLKTVSGETRFLLREQDEINYTVEQETAFINSHNESEKAMLILAFVDGEYAGNCSFQGETGSRRAGHRAGIGIALYQKYTGFGLGKLMLEILLKEMKACGFEQAELTVVSNNDRAYHLYSRLGFKECGRIPNANKYNDGTYSDDVFMVKRL